METTPQVRDHLTANSHMKKKDIIMGNFLGGLAWGIGTVIGAGVVVGIIGTILKKLGILEVIGQLFQ